MDAFDFKPDSKEEKPKSKREHTLLTLGTYYFIASSIVLAALFVLIYTNPYTPLNPFMPPTPTTGETSLESLPTNTAAVQAAFTQTPTLTETLATAPSATPVEITPTATFIPYPTPTDVVLATGLPVDTPEKLAHFTTQEDTPSYIAYGGGCSGVYVAGNVLDINDRPVVLMTVRVTGTIGGQTINLETRSGSNTEYSESGWEIQLSDQLINTNGTITVGLYAQGVFDPISDLVVINTYSDCSRNLAVVNFVQDE